MRPKASYNTSIGQKSHWDHPWGPKKTKVGVCTFSEIGWGENFTPRLGLSYATDSSLGVKFSPQPFLPQIGLKFGTLANLDPRIPKKWVPRVRSTPGVRGPGPRIPQDLVEPRCPLSPIGLKFGTVANSDPRILKTMSNYWVPEVSDPK